jgi:hypothetical protein
LSPALTATHEHYEPYGAALQLLRCGSPEVLVSGPAGTGKSVACLWKLHFCATEVPGFRGLILRRTRASLTDSALVTFERDVLPPTHPALDGAHRENRHSYRYPNGSEIVLGGLDMVSRIMSSEYDLAYVQEAIELPEEGWEAVTTRLRNGRLQFQQLVGDTNPSTPTHWLKKRCDGGRTKLLESRHEDNPRLWDGRQWTDQGREYLDRLDALTGPRKLRLRYGRWVQAEGVVYPEYDPAIHLIDRFPIPSNWPRLWSVDFGHSNPFVWQAWALDDDGRLYRYREIYHTKRLVEDHARQILQVTRNDPPPVAIVCDHDAEGRATLERHVGQETCAAIKAILAGIEAVAARLRVQGDGRPRLYLLRDSLVERDQALAESKKPTCTEEEMDGYIWQSKGKEAPVKEADHGCDALRYLCSSLDLA